MSKDKKADVANSLDDLTLVGERKLLGYLPLSTIFENCRADPHDLLKAAEAKGLKALILGKEETYIPSGALFVYDPLKLQDYLLVQQNRDILERNGWPTDAADFVKSVAAFFVDPARSSFDLANRKTLCDLIALTFNDPRPEYQNFKQYPEGPSVPHVYKDTALSSEISAHAPTFRGTIRKIIRHHKI